MIVSFIIPAYNAADTIERCLNSIYALSLKRDEFEVIVVDDCSSDKTVNVIEQYRKKELGNEGVSELGNTANRSSLIANRNGSSNLTLLRQPENHRQGAARNRGVLVAKGVYICFVDADDAVTEGVVEAIRMAKEKAADMVPYHLAYSDEKGNITREEVHLSYQPGEMFTGIQMQNKHPYWLSGPVAYIYNRAFLERVNYPFAEDVLYEDSDFVVVHLYHAIHMFYSAELGYIVYYREGSTTRSVNHKNVADYLILGTRMMAFYERVKSERLTNERVNELENEGVNAFAEGILEGACWNVERSCRRLIKLGSIKEVRAYYDRVDTYTDRSSIVANKHYRSYYWNGWTGLCLVYRELNIVLLTVLIPIYRFLKR